MRARSVTPLFRGVYLGPSGSNTLVARAQGLAEVLPSDAQFSHHTAAELYGAPAPRTDELHVSVAASRTTPRRRRGVVTHARLRAGEPRLIDELLVTSPEQTFLDLAAVLSLDEAVVLGDYFVRNWVSRSRLTGHVATAPRGTRGVVRAREALALVREGVNSPPETLLRLHIVRNGLPEPAVNPTIYDSAGGWLGEPDLAHLLQRVLTQYDGDVHRTTIRRWRQDIARDEAFRDDGWTVLRATGSDLAHPGPYLTRLRRYLREAGGW